MDRLSAGHASLALQHAPEATPPANHTWRSYYHAAGRRVAMRVQDGATGANQACHREMTAGHKQATGTNA